MENRKIGMFSRVGYRLHRRLLFYSVFPVGQIMFPFLDFGQFMLPLDSALKARKTGKGSFIGQYMLLLIGHDILILTLCT